MNQLNEQVRQHLKEVHNEPWKLEKTEKGQSRSCFNLATMKAKHGHLYQYNPHKNKSK